MQDVNGAMAKLQKTVARDRGPQVNGPLGNYPLGSNAVGAALNQNPAEAVRDLGGLGGLRG